MIGCSKVFENCRKYISKNLSKENLVWKKEFEKARQLSWSQIKNNHKIDNGFVCLTLSTAEKSECEVTLHDIQINELALAFSATLG